MTCVISGDTGVSAVQTGAVQQGDLASDALGVALLAANGYQKLPNGLIIQWGSINVPLSNVTSAGVDVTLPIPFPNAALQTLGTLKSAGASTDKVGGLYTTPLNTATINVTVAATTLVNASYGVSWIAIGY